MVAVGAVMGIGGVIIAYQKYTKKDIKTAIRCGSIISRTVLLLFPSGAAQTARRLLIPFSAHLGAGVYDLFRRHQSKRSRLILGTEYHALGEHSAQLDGP